MGRRIIAYASGPMVVSTEKRKLDGDEPFLLQELLLVRRLFPEDKVSKPKSVNLLSLSSKFSEDHQYEQNDSSRTDFFPLVQLE